MSSKDYFKKTAMICCRFLPLNFMKSYCEMLRKHGHMLEKDKLIFKNSLRQHIIKSDFE